MTEVNDMGQWWPALPVAGKALYLYPILTQRNEHFQTNCMSISYKTRKQSDKNQSYKIRREIQGIHVHSLSDDHSDYQIENTKPFDYADLNHTSCATNRPTKQRILKHDFRM